MAGQPKSRVKELAAARLAPLRRDKPAWQDDDLIEAICADLAQGCSFETTGLAHGLGHSTLGKWAKEAVDAAIAIADNPEADVASDPAKVLAGVRLLRAHAGASQDLERRLHAGEVWALEVLARRHRGTWGRQDAMALTVEKADPAATLALALTKIGPAAPNADT